MNLKEYLKPELEIEKFILADVVSNDDPEDDDGDGGYVDLSGLPPF